MKKLLVLFCILLTSHVYSDRAHVGYVTGELDSGAFSIDIDGFRLGYQFVIDENFTAQVDFASIEGETAVSGTAIDLEGESFAVSIRPLLFGTGDVNIYGIIGYNTIEYTITAPALGTSADADEDDIIYGIGAAFAMTETIDAVLEWQSYYDDDDDEIDAVYLGLSSDL